MPPFNEVHLRFNVTLARDIAQKIEETMQYPGQIKMTVMRETGAMGYAKL
jgi:HD superfamily phosphodiesterase